MDSIETLIPDNEGNHLVVVLNFCDDTVKQLMFQLPEEFGAFEIADISINKIYIDKPLGLDAFYGMCQWLTKQLNLFSNAIFWFICSTQSLPKNHPSMSAAQCRWNLFEYFYKKYIPILRKMGIESKDIIVGQENEQTFARVFYRTSHAPIIHIVEGNIKSNKP